SINSGNKGKRRYNYFISTSNTQLNKRDNQCICTIHNCYTATGTNCFSKLIFEFLNYSGTGPDTAPYNLKQSFLVRFRIPPRPSWPLFRPQRGTSQNCRFTFCALYYICKKRGRSSHSQGSSKTCNSIGFYKFPP